MKKEWTTVINITAKIETTLAEMREADHHWSIDLQKLKHKKNRLDQDVSLLSNTTDSIDRVAKEIEGLVLSWSNLASYCRNIQSEVAIVRGNLLPENATDDTQIFVPSAEQLTEINQRLEKIRKGMNQVGKVAKFYVEVYDSSLSSLAAQLDQMMTISDKSPVTLEKNLVNAGTNTSRKIDEIEGREVDSITTVNPFA